MENNYLGLVDIENIEYTDEYVNMIDVSVDIDESFCLSNGIISHNSASSTAVEGFSVVGRDYFGSFPLKGKPLNVRDASLKKVHENDEIKNIISTLGLEFGRKYKSTRDLRYGKIVIMTDADVDGNHIKGLIINLFDTYWKELLQLDFIYEFITPIVKVTKGKETKYFYKLDDYNRWKETVNTKNWFIKYYKGLGTIEDFESEMFFKNIKKHLIKFNYENEEVTEDKIDMLFRKNRVNDRKAWLETYKPNNFFDKFSQKTTYTTFVENEMIEFSMEDNIRSIPSVVDGLKPSQRKVLYTLFKKNYKNEVKVSQFVGSVTELSAYHHGACLDYDTEILLGDGSYIKIGEWCERYPDVELLVKCIDENNNETISIGKNPISLKSEIEYYEIELEDGSIIECTDNHKFFVDGKYIEAKNLEENMNILDITQTLDKNDL